MPLSSINATIWALKLLRPLEKLIIVEALKLALIHNSDIPYIPGYIHDPQVTQSSLEWVGSLKERTK